MQNQRFLKGQIYNKCEQKKEITIESEKNKN